MLRAVGRQVLSGVRAGITRTGYLSQLRHYHIDENETPEELDRRYLGYFERPDIDGWEIRKRLQELYDMDLIPEPEIIIASLKACRRVNDYGLCVRWLECLRHKGDGADKKIYPYILQEIRPTLDELGISTPEEMGYDKPELHMETPYNY